jgi:hypothetical protein
MLPIAAGVAGVLLAAMLVAVHRRRRAAASLDDAIEGELQEILAGARDAGSPDVPSERASV